MWSKSLLFMALFSCAAAAQATDIAKWVDADGVTHFGNPQFAPSQAQPVEVHPANAMDAPDTSVLNKKRSSPQFRTIKKAEKKNKRGWRGHNFKRSGNRGYRR